MGVYEDGLFFVGVVVIFLDYYFYFANNDEILSYLLDFSVLEHVALDVSYLGGVHGRRGVRRGHYHHAARYMDSRRCSCHEVHRTDLALRRDLRRVPAWGS